MRSPEEIKEQVQRIISAGTGMPEPVEVRTEKIVNLIRLAVREAVEEAKQVVWDKFARSKRELCFEIEEHFKEYLK